MRIAWIKWTDAITSAEPGWTTREEALQAASSPLPIMYTVGYILHNDDSHIALTDSVGDDEFGQVTKIPKSMIVEYDYLRRENDEETIDIPLI
jgi:hypothetical protein